MREWLWVRCAPSARPKSDAGVSCRTARCRARWAGANARAAIGPDIGRVCAVQVKRETAARGGREGMRVQTLWNLLEVVLPVTAEAVADVTRAHAHTQPSQGAHNVLHFGGYESISSDLPVGHRTRSRMLTLVYGQDSAVGTWGERTPQMSPIRLGSS